MGKIFTLFSMLLLAVSFTSFSQQTRTCSTMENLERLKRENPALEKTMQKIDIHAAEWEKAHGHSRSAAVITIPVVVHVVYKNATQNVSDAQIQSQIDALNKDFRRLNTDASSTPSVFQGVAADTQIEFCLAKRDPQGNASTGITRTSTNSSSFSDDDKVKFTAQGGKDVWDRDKYLNLWVCDLGSMLLGYAQFPGDAANTDGVVINYRYFGTTGTATSPFHKGRTATHEIGHWLNLRHIWGDSNCGNDQVSDTPTQQSSNDGCPNFPKVTCNNGPNGDMFMNYMDYSNDACMNIFTVGQTSRMTAVLNGSRASLKSSNGCVPVVLQTDDAELSAISSPGGSSCSTSITPSIVLKNNGSANLVSATISYKVDAGAVSTYQWQGNLASLATVVVALPAITVSGGSHTFTATTSVPNGKTDGNTANDSKTVSFTVLTTGSALPLAEGFESTFVPSGWTLNNGDGGITWAKTSQAKKTGTSSIKIDNYNYNAPGEIDELILPALNFQGASNPSLTFEVAYQMYTNPAASQNFSDTLQVLVSADCGATYTSVYKKFGTALTTLTPTYSTSSFVPSASQWRKETIDLSALAGIQNAMVKIRHICGYENNMYLDDINITSTTGILSLMSGKEISVHPNPSKGIFTLNSNFNQGAIISIYNVLGALVKEQSLPVAVSSASFDLSGHSEGIYVMKIVDGEYTYSKKIVLAE